MGGCRGGGRLGGRGGGGVGPHERQISGGYGGRVGELPTSHSSSSPSSSATGDGLGSTSRGAHAYELPPRPRTVVHVKSARHAPCAGHFRMHTTNAEAHSTLHCGTVTPSTLILCAGVPAQRERPAHSQKGR